MLFAGTPSVTWSAAGTLPPGYERAGQFGILPAIGGRRFAVSLATRAGAASALTSYNSLRTVPRQVVRAALGAGLRTGLAQHLMRPRIEIGVRADASHDQRDCDLLTDYLRHRLGCGPVVVAFAGNPGPYRKPVLQVFRTDGAPLAYIKIGWNDWTREAVRREASVLRACHSRPSRVGVPGLLGHDVWQGLDLLITAPLPAGVTRVGLYTPIPDVGLLREISQFSRCYSAELQASPWWQRLQARIAAVKDPAARAQLTRVMTSVAVAHGRSTMQFGSWHGDFVPWNLGRVGHRIYAWDWESSAPDVPVGFDALHYYFQVAFVARRRLLPAAAAEATQRAATALETLGLAADARDLVAALHLAELFLRHEEARSCTGQADGRFYPAVASTLTDLLERARPAAWAARGAA